MKQKSETPTSVQTQSPCEELESFFKENCRFDIFYKYRMLRKNNSSYSRSFDIDKREKELHALLISEPPLSDTKKELVKRLEKEIDDLRNESMMSYYMENPIEFKCQENKNKITMTYDVDGAIEGDGDGIGHSWESTCQIIADKDTFKKLPPNDHKYIASFTGSRKCKVKTDRSESTREINESYEEYYIRRTF